MAAFLVPLQSGACVIPLEKAILLIGRQADCDVSLTSSRKISRKHCCIAIVNDSVVVRDLGSTNGVTINGLRVEKEGRLRLGDELSIGDVRFRLQKDAKLAPQGAAAKAAEAVVAEDSRPPGRLTMPEDENGKLPVPLEDEGEEFAVESSYPKLRPQQNDGMMDSGPLVPYLPTDRGARPLASDSL